jgi:pyruvate/2-oxoglutarate dehydrogenase complex dihydrolipoamide dehydrogenase (E3) component
MSASNISERYEVIVLGCGKGGKTLATELGNKGVKTALIERSAEMIGGTCINVACIPTKTFITSARVAQAVRRAGDFGIRTGDVAMDWAGVRRRAEGVVAAMRAMNHKNFTSAPALDFILGSGRFVEPHVIEVRENNGDVRRLSAEKIFINTGTRPAQPSISGLDEVNALNSESIQRLNELPDHLIVLGGSYVALEFAQMFRHFGSKVTVLERAAQLLKREDADVVEVLGGVMREEGIEIQLNCSVERVEKDGKGVAVVLATDGKATRVSGSHLLVALGRTPNTEELNLAAAGVETDKRGFVKVNERLETSATDIWALGDVNGGPQFTHASLDDYRIVKANVFDGGRRTTADRLVPFTLFTEPELARVGVTEKEARQQGLDIRVAKFPVASIPRAKTMSESRGLMKAIVDAKTNRILGCAILSVEAGEMLGTVQMAMIAGLQFTVLRDAVLSHPTMVEGFNNLFANFPQSERLNQPN